MKIKLKMGKGEDESAEQPADESPDSKEESPTEEAKPEGDDKEKPEELPAEPIPEAKEEASEDDDKKKKDAEALRKVIKVDSGGGDDAPVAKEDDPDLVEDDAGDDTGGPASRESLEQKRAILQSIKDFDFQIKKNQEDVTNVNQKLDGMSKDLDDLVSLYEIVSEQMNPFVGLSKVTKKRLDALENFTREIDLLKERTGELESFAERSGIKLKNITEGEHHAETIDTDALLGKEDEESQVTGEGDIATEESAKGDVTDEGSGELLPGETEQSTPEAEKVETAIEEPKPDENETPVETPTENVVETVDETFTMETQQPPTYITTPVEDNGFENLSDAALDIILDKAFGAMSPEGKVDMLIDEFIESLKG